MGQELVCRIGVVFLMVVETGGATVVRMEQ